MKRLGIVAVGLALVVGLVVCTASLVRAQPVASITLPSPGATKELFPGCNNVSLTFPGGTASEMVVQAVSPAGVVEAMWRYNAAVNAFEGFSPAAPQASDLLSLNFLDAVWLCVAGATPAAPTSPADAATATPLPAPEPTATAVQQALTADQYRNAIQSVNDALTHAMGTCANLMNYPLFDDPLWRQAVRDQINVFRSSYATWLGLVPPPEFAEFHAQWETALSLLAQAADLIEVGIDNRDPAALSRANDLVYEATTHLALGAALLP